MLLYCCLGERIQVSGAIGIGENNQLLGEGAGGFRLLVTEFIPPFTPYLGSGDQVVDLVDACMNSQEIGKQLEGFKQTNFIIS